MKSLSLGALALLLLSPAAARAHGDLHDQIRAVTRAIAANPGDATLYLKRGELHRAHHEPRQARADYDRALTLAPSLDAARLARARLLVETGHAGEAEPDLAAFLARHPRHVEATLVRAHARQTLGDVAGAVADYDVVLAVAPDPDRGLERARLLASTGRDADRQAALAGLDGLIARLGPIVTLQLEAIALLAASREFDAALARIDQAITHGSAQPHRWLVRKADLLRHAGRLTEARQAYLEARAALDRLPPARRESREHQRSRTAIADALESLEPSVERGPDRP